MALFGKNILDYASTSGIYEGNNKYYIHPDANLTQYNYLGEFCVIESRAQLSNCLLGRMAHIESSVLLGYKSIHKKSVINHPIAYKNTSRYFSNSLFKLPRKFMYENSPLTLIDNDVRVCTNSIIAAGVKIGRGAIVLPNTYVENDVPPYAVVGGSPARLIEYRFSEEERAFLSDIKIEESDFSLDFWRNKKLNFQNIEQFKTNYRYRKIQLTDYDSQEKATNLIDSKILVLGPSHVDRWINLIKDKQLGHPPFVLFGRGGLSITSPSITNYVDFWLSRDSRNIVVILVPDFRIGNSYILENDRNALFIDKNLMKGDESDRILRRRYFNVLDNLSDKYGKRVRYIFWCQYGRQYLNIKQGKYIDNNGNYKHIMDYNQLKMRYAKNIIDIPEIDNYLDYIERDGSIHPTIAGYNFLEKIIKESNVHS